MEENFITCTGCRHRCWCFGGECEEGTSCLNSSPTYYTALQPHKAGRCSLRHTVTGPGSFATRKPGCGGSEQKPSSIPFLHSLPPFVPRSILLSVSAVPQLSKSELLHSPLPNSKTRSPEANPTRHPEGNEHTSSLRATMEGNTEGNIEAPNEGCNGGGLEERESFFLR